MLLHEELKEWKLILGSRSPRRRELIAGAKLEFTLADNYDVDEVFPAELAAIDVAPYLSQLKSEGYPTELSGNEILITADTVVISDGRVLGKPADREDAVEMIRSMSGAEHLVVTGVTIRGRERVETFSAQTRVWFRRLDDDEIEYYVDTFRPYDKAGAYGIQEWIGYVAIERIEGSFYNVMGLPIQQLYKNLKTFIRK